VEVASSIDIALVADQHVGSKYGLWPPRFYDQFGNCVPLNKGQKYLRGKWIDVIACLPDPIDILIFNGDLIDGEAPKDKGWASMTTRLSTQRAACVVVNTPLTKKAKKIYATEGTDYHETHEGAQDLAEDLGAIPNTTGKAWIYARPSLDLKVGEVYIEARHKLSGAVKYTSRALQNELEEARIAALRKGYIPSLIFGGHWHKYYVVEDAEGAAIACPGFELQRWWAKKQRRSRWMPDIGVVWVRIYPKRHRWGRKAWEIHRILYSHPRDSVEVVEI